MFLALDEADLFQSRKLLLGFGWFANHQIEFTEMFLRLRWRRLSIIARW